MSNLATLKRVANANTFAFGRYPYAHHSQYRTATRRISKYQVFVGSDLLAEYPNKKQAIEAIEKYGLVL